MLFLLALVTLSSGLVAAVTGLPSRNQQPILPFAPLHEQHSTTTPHSEPIEITSVPLPPVVSSREPGACSYAINSHGTGCIAQATGLQAGNFLPDGEHILATLKFSGAPAAPDPRSIYEGQQLVVLKVDGSLFPNGDSWKCLTCGAHTDDAAVASDREYKYPQAFPDGRRALGGAFVVDCGEALLVSEECSPEQTAIYPIRLENTEDGSGAGATTRELRLHPDGVHIGFSVFSFANGRLGQTSYIGRLQFDASPTTGSTYGPRYNLVNVSQLYDPNGPQPISIERHEVVIDREAIVVGELSGFSGTGQEVLYLGYPHECCNIDVFAAHLETGKVRRLTSHPGYVDPVQMSPDDKSIVIMDTRGNDRTTFMAGLRGVPPLVDQVTTTACSSVRNNGRRRFFQPFLLDAQGDSDGYYGQELNSASSGEPGTGAVDDPEWNGRADPWFSPDGSRIVYWQAKTLEPACGGDNNPLPCYNSTEPGGAFERVMIAHLTSRNPLKPHAVQPMADNIPWAVPYTPGKPATPRTSPKPGNYTLRGAVSGHADVRFLANEGATRLRTVEVDYHAFSNDGRSFLDGSHRVTEDIERVTMDRLEWFSDLAWSGEYVGSQATSPGGFRLAIDVMKNEFWAEGTLITVLGGVEFGQPRNGQ